ncbi:MAG: hypothetical protein ABTQ73_05305 [Caldilineales bacterium]
MKPLAHWAIHHRWKLRLAGRNRIHLWGTLVAPDGSEQFFRYNQLVKYLIIGKDAQARGLQLDDYGMVVEEKEIEAESKE